MTGPLADRGEERKAWRAYCRLGFDASRPSCLAVSHPVEGVLWAWLSTVCVLSGMCCLACMLVCSVSHVLLGLT